MLVSKSIPNLINGISQQSDALRLPTQAEAQSNLYSSVVEGLSDRPPTEHIAKIFTGAVGDAFEHLINRDATERYVVLVTNGDLTVHTIAGVVKAVAFPNGKGYLSNATPSTKTKAITVADYTFIVNTATLVAMKAATTTVRPKEALIFVKQGNYGSDYKILIDGVQRALKTTSTTNVSDLATNLIADALRAALVTNLGAGWTVTRYGPVISVVKATGDFKITSEDSQGGTSLQVFKDSTQVFTSLPTVAPTDFQIAVTGAPESAIDDYYVKFTPATAGETFGEGAWEETVAGGIPYQIDATTMPHILVREVGGTFTFKEATWDNRTVGDAATAAAPSFVSNTVNDIFYFKNRLTLLSSDGTIASEVGEYFNFWPVTVTTALDSDRIDYQVSHTKVSVLRHAVPFDEKVVLFSDQTQFIMQGGQTLTQKTIQVDPATEFENSLTAKPVGTGKNVYFATPNGQFNGVREFSVDQVTAARDAVSVTSHTPKYIPAGIFKFATSSTEDILVALTSGDPTKVYIYKFFYAGEEKLQSSWSRFTLGGAGTVVLGADFIESILYLTVQRIGGVYFEKLDFSPGAVDAGVNFVTHYDRRLTEAQCTSVVYAAGVTTWTLPYVVDGTMKVVTREVNPGLLITVTNPTTTTLVASGNYSATKVYIGQTYSRSYILSKFHLREEGKDGKSIVMTGRLQVRSATLAYADTGTFTVTVSPDYRAPSSFVEYRDPADATFTGRILGAGSNLLGAVALATGKFTFPVLSKNDRVTIEISSDSFLPMHLLSLDWEGLYHARSKRM